MAHPTVLRGAAWWANGRWWVRYGDGIDDGWGRPFDGIGGPAAVLFAPLAVRWFYGEGR